ncbi:hypothetical protein NLI96_g7160 [Meripilus lineatus]|uniref:Ribonuclease H2 subunit B n=1 Tax=Meripilus lineatus TaxID=2056292 RepID=A0AAD5YD77_9APHY|nr:hypothetical protein NLI96_g7160 [Physisporinus lineatus]
MSPRIAILPTDLLNSLLIKLDGDDGGRTASSVRFLRLPHPRTGIPSLYLPSPGEGGKTSILEVQRMCPPNQRSWFMSDNEVIEARWFSRGIPPRRRTLGRGDWVVYRAEFKQEITPEITVYRFSSSHVVEYLKNKVLRLARPDVFEGSQTLTRSLAKDGFLEDGKESLLESARIRVACELVSQYVPKKMFDALISSFESVVNLSDVNAHLEAASAAAMRLAAIASKPPTKGPGATGTGEGGKKRKSQKGSQGVEKLKKANVKGMAKLSSFFQPKTA